MAARLGKIPTTSVRRRISLFSRSCGLFDQIWRQISRGNAVNASRSSRASSRCVGGVGELGLDRVHDPGVLGVDRVGVGLVEDRADQRRDPRLGRLRDFREQIAQVVGAAPLPGRAGQGGADRVDQAAVGVGDDQPDPGQATGGQRSQERQPAGAVLVGGDVQAEDLAVAVGVDTDRDQGVRR